jgi:hypothetical protein
MKVNVTLDDKKVQAMLKKYPKRIKRASKTAIAYASVFVLKTIKDRTAAGRGVAGSFAPYASTRGSGRQSGRVDLFDKGLMIGAMRSKAASPFLGIVFFNSASESRKAMWHHTGAGHLPVRKWFDVNSREEVLVGNQFRNEFIKQMARA